MNAKLIASVIKSLQPEEKPYEVNDKTLKGFLLRVQPSGAMTYYFAYRTTDGRKTRYRIGAVGAVTPAQARDVAEQLSARVIGGEDVQATKKEARHEAEMAKLQTLGGFLAQQYAPWLQAERPEKRRPVATLKRLQANFADIMGTPMADITPWTIEKWRAEQRKAGKATTTINRDVTALRSVLSKAVAWHVIDRHPLQSLKPLKVDKHGSIRYLTEDEEIRLRTTLAQRDTRMKAARARGNAWRRERNYPEMPSMDGQTSGDHLTPMVLLSLNTGIRRGELFNLTWRDVHFATKTLTVRGATSKTMQTRYVPLNREALAVLTAWREQSPGDGLVFPGRGGERLDNVRKAWIALLREANITGFRWHDLRHHFASKLVMNGTPLYTVQQLLGHSSPMMTTKYSHLSPDHKAAAVERLCPPVAAGTRSTAHA